MALIIEKALVESSNIKAIGYDATSRVLQVEFINGSVYNYLEVPSEQHQAIMNPPVEFDGSHGKYLNARIKGSFEFEKIKEPTVLPKTKKSPVTPKESV